MKLCKDSRLVNIFKFIEVKIWPISLIYKENWNPQPYVSYIKAPSSTTLPVGNSSRPTL